MRGPRAAGPGRGLVGHSRDGRCYPCRPIEQAYNTPSVFEVGRVKNRRQLEPSRVQEALTCEKKMKSWDVDSSVLHCLAQSVLSCRVPLPGRSNLRRQRGDPGSPSRTGGIYRPEVIVGAVRQPQLDRRKCRREWSADVCVPSPSPSAQDGDLGDLVLVGGRLLMGMARRRAIRETAYCAARGPAEDSPVSSPC